MAIKPGMTRDELNELAAHCYASWSSKFQKEKIFLFKLKGDPHDHFLTRTETVHRESKDVIDDSRQVAVYENGIAVQIVATPMVIRLRELKFELSPG
ncbi:hypothetical protein LC612_29370 [Nostoc sp. CHAB 5834]|nr:hypothetical protein [Nostoc sp. CHAB 5834]